MWCDLMVADGPLNEVDSITSGYNVPCARKSMPPIRSASRSNISMKVDPMILRFFSGSSTPASRVQEELRCVYRVQVDAEGLECHCDIFKLVLPQHAVVDKDTVQPVPYGPV